jgi:hypothetical protein
MTALAAASTIPHRRTRSSARIGALVLVLGAPIVIEHGASATTIDGAPWASIGDRLIVAATDGVIAVVEVASVDRGGNPHVQLVSGELAPGDCRIMRAPLVGDRLRALVRRAVLRPVGGP